MARRLRPGPKACRRQPQQAPVAIHFQRRQHGAKASIAALAGPRIASASSAPSSSNCAITCSPGSSTIPGITCTKPEGAFYVYPNISAYLGKGGIKTATELATRLLHEGHVVTVPGEAFGTSEHIRISYPVTRQNIDEGVRRMGEFLTGLA